MKTLTEFLATPLNTLGAGNPGVEVGKEINATEPLVVKKKKVVKKHLDK